jgi:hypothetical protein
MTTDFRELFGMPALERTSKNCDEAVLWDTICGLRSDVSVRVLVALYFRVSSVDAQTGVLEINGRIKVDGKQERLKRNASIIFRGGSRGKQGSRRSDPYRRISSRAIVFTAVLNASPEFRAGLKRKIANRLLSRDNR